jgi:BNR repeat-like domain
MRSSSRAALAMALCALGSCGGDNSGTRIVEPTAPPFSSVPQVQVSQAQAPAANCDGVAVDGTLFAGTAIEPSVASSVTNTANLIAVWQQNRWSTGGSQAIGIAASFDGGQTWTQSSAAFSRCSGGGSANAGNYARASNPWVTTSPNGFAYALALTFTGEMFASGSTSGMLVARSVDGGTSWSLPTALIGDGSNFFNDKGAITADPTDSNYVYAVWDRLQGEIAGPSYLSLTADAGSSWQAARSIYDPGPNNQTIGNAVVVTPAGTLVDVFNEIDNTGGTAASHVRVIRSADHGTSWSAPVEVAELLSVGTSDPRNGDAVRDSALLFSTTVSPAGVIYAAWQDARFSNGDHDGIALAWSTDDGLTWSAPLEVNGDASAAAFTPTVAVNADGTIAVTYYDLRNVDESASMLLADHWMVVSPDGTNFTESHISGPFDLHRAPKVTEGYFLGDYQGLLTAGADFMPVLAQPNPGTNISTGVYISFPAQATASALGQVHRAFRAMPGSHARLSSAVRQRISAHIRLAVRQRLHP